MRQLLGAAGPVLAAILAAAAAHAQQAAAPAQAAPYHEVDDESLVVEPLGITVDRLEDMDVVTAEGERIGEVDEVLADGSGRVVAVTIETEGRLGLGEREVVVGLDRLELAGDRLRTTLTPAELEALPTWD